MVQHKIAFVSLFSSLLLCQASPFVYEDYFAYPRYTLELTEKKLPESSVFGHQQGRHIGQWNNQDRSNDEQNQVIMMTANAQPFLCTIPTVTTTQSNQHSSASTNTNTNTNTKSSQSLEETQHIIERGLELLKPLEKRCLYYNPRGYWTYEYCHGRYVRQFHIDPNQVNNGGDNILVDKKSSYILGTFPDHQDGGKGNTLYTDGNSNEATTLPQQQRHDIIDKKQSPLPPSDHTIPTTTLRHIGGQEQQQQVLVQHWNGGTPCDITNQPRAIDIQFQCAAHDTDEIAFFEEVSTCHYRMIIATPRLCDDVALGRKRQAKSHTIECNPIVPEYQLTDHEQQQQQQEDEDISIDHTTQQQQQPDDDNSNTLTKQSSDTDTTQEQQQQQQQSEDGAPMEENEDVAKTDLIGMISNLAKQVEQLQRSMEQQYILDHHGMQQQQHQQQQYQQQNHLVFMDQHGQWVVAPGTTINEHDTGFTAQAFLKQFFSNGATSPSRSSSFQDTQKQPPSDEASGSQQQNRKAYEKMYYT